MLRNLVECPGKENPSSLATCIRFDYVDLVPNRVPLTVKLSSKICKLTCRNENGGEKMRGRREWRRKDEREKRMEENR